MQWMCFFSSLLVVSFPGPLKEENLLPVPKPLPKQLWETKEVSEQNSTVFIVTEYLYFTGHCKILQRRKRGIGKKGREDLSGDGDRKNIPGNDGSNKKYHIVWWISTVISWLPNWHVELTHSGKPVSPPYLIRITESTEALLQVIGRLFCFVASIFYQSPASIQNCRFTRYPHFLSRAFDLSPQGVGKQVICFMISVILWVFVPTVVLADLHRALTVEEGDAPWCLTLPFFPQGSCVAFEKKKKLRRPSPWWCSVATACIVSILDYPAGLGFLWSSSIFLPCPPRSLLALWWPWKIFCKSKIYSILHLWWEVYVIWFKIHILKHRSRSYTLPFWLWEAQVVLEAFISTIISSPAKVAVAPTLPGSVLSGSRCSSSLVLQDLLSSINDFWEKKWVSRFIHVLQHTLYLLSTLCQVFYIQRFCNKQDKNSCLLPLLELIL